MREILFRGKMGDGKWVVGSLLKSTYTPQGQATYWIAEDSGMHWKVIPETVGQFTGLLDKNGKKIFEGDTVQFSSRIFKGSMIQATIGFMNGKFGYLASSAIQIKKPDGWDEEFDCTETIAFLLNDLVIIEDGFLDRSGTCSDQFEVIGNIHDKGA